MVMNEANYYIFRYLTSKKKIWCLHFEIPQGDDEWNSKPRKNTKRENPKKLSPSVKYIILNINLLKLCINN